MTARQGRDLIARHGETVFNAVARVQGDATHTPLTRTGVAQAEEIGRALAGLLRAAPSAPPNGRITLWSSPSGRTLQTLAIIVEHLGLDWHDVRTDERLCEIDVGAWTGLAYAELAADAPVFDPATGLFARAAPGGEWYDDVARRLTGWLVETDEPGDRLIVMHGMSSRVLRGIMTGAPIAAASRAQSAAGEAQGRLPRAVGTPVAPGLPQGSVVMIADGAERWCHRGAGRAPA